MAFHYITNKGKLLLVQGLWDDAGSSAVKVGLLAGASVPTGIDTEAELQDLNTVGDLLGITSVDEPVGGWYSRLALARTNAAEDDTNNRVNMAIAALLWADATAGESIYGMFWYDGSTDTNDTTRLLCGVATFTAVPLNGSDFQLNAGDLVRAV